MASGALREDLFYRMNTIEVHVPPLRERADDIQGLAEFFLRDFAEKYARPARAISQQAYGYLFTHDWPGNVRELRNQIERAVLLTKGETIGIEALQVGHVAARGVAAGAGASTVPAIEMFKQDVLDTAAEVGPPAGSDDLTGLGREILGRVTVRRDAESTTDVLTQVEKAIVSAALKQTRGNKQAASHLLGVYRPRLYHMIKKYDLVEQN